MGVMSVYSARWRALLTVVVSFLALFALEREFEHISWGGLQEEVAGLSWGAMLLSAAATLMSYVLLVVFDWLGVRSVSARVSPFRLASTSFTANALGHSLGMAFLTGGTMRLKGYGEAGLTLSDVGWIALHASMGFALGAWTLAGLTLILNAEHLTEVLAGSPLVWQSLGGGLLSALVALLLFVGNTSRRVVIRGKTLYLPSRKNMLIAVVTSSLELCCAAAALFVLLPAVPGLNFFNFVGFYITGIIAGVVSTVPAGLGVFEWTMTQLLPQVPKEALLASIVVYRLIYYVFPLVLAMLGLLLVTTNSTLRRMGGMVTASTPVLAAMAVFFAGAWLLFGGVVPTAKATIVSTPLRVLEVSHFLGSVSGVLLLMLAEGIRRRNQGAWLLTEVTLILGAVMALLRGDSIWLPICFWTLFGLLLISHRYFSRPAALLTGRFSVFWWRNVALVALGAFWLMLFSYRNVPYQDALWWEFELKGDAPRALRAFAAGALILLLVGLVQLLRPLPRREPLPDEKELNELKPVIEAASSTTANLAYMGDKALLRLPGVNGFVMYQRSGRSLIAMGDPVADAKGRAQLRWAFRELAEQRGLRCVFYQVGREDLEAYLDQGMLLIKLGEEALVELERFSLEGSARAGLRQAYNRGIRNHLKVVYVPPEAFSDWLPQLQTISNEWLALKAGGEKGFSLGYFNEAYLRHFTHAVVMHEDRPVAFCNLWTAPAVGELSIDLMRHGADAPKGVMDFLFIELMLWGKAQGYKAFNLGMAPLAGMAEHRLAARSQRLLRFIASHSDRFYDFQGLYHYKSKFDPVWRSRYLAAPGELSLPSVFVDLTRLISGGLKGVLKRG